MERLRIKYAKTEPMRYTGNLDVHRAWERLLRRACLPLAYSHGFHPQPRLNQASPLPLGFISQAEMIDIWLDQDLDLEFVQNAIDQSAPPGIVIQKVERVDLSVPALATQTRFADYQVTLLEPVEEAVIQKQISQLLAAETLPKIRRGKSYDLRPLIDQMKWIPAADGSKAYIYLRLSAQEGATGRPDEVLDALGISMQAARVERIALHLC